MFVAIKKAAEVALQTSVEAAAAAAASSRICEDFDKMIHYLDGDNYNWQAMFYCCLEMGLGFEWVKLFMKVKNETRET